MATASTSGQSTFGLGRKKKNPGVMDQITKFFGGGDKKKRSKGSFRGHLATSPQQSSARRRTNENAVVHFFRSFVSSPRPKSRWRDALGLASSPRPESAKSPVRRRRDQSTLSKIFNLVSLPPPTCLTEIHPPSLSVRLGFIKHCLLFVFDPKCNSDALTRDQEKPSPVHPQNAGAPSSKPSAEDEAADPAGRGEGGEQAADSQPPETLTH
uniref:Myelin basic protein n=2 Tax=Gasterosteus aculeatus aculeatus TaxID=481459 RepID=A0AAQ4P8M7_GASAC